VAAGFLLAGCPSPDEVSDNDNANLSGITLSSGTLSPAFDPSTTVYEVTVPNNVTSITITGTKADPGATVSAPVILGPLVAGSEEWATITVTSANGRTKEYELFVTRAEAPSSDATLENLLSFPGTLTPEFSPATTAYTVSVTNATTSVWLAGLPTDDGAIVTPPITLSGLVVGAAQTATFLVTSEDGSATSTYTVTVTRLPPPSGNADLGALALSSGTLSPAFAGGTTAYTVSLDNAVASVTITGTPADANATVSAPVTLSGLLIGTTKPATLTVTAQNGTTKAYSFAVTRVTAPPPADLVSATVGTLKGVPAGSFQRDSWTNDLSTVSGAFHMGATEVTRTQFLAVVGTDPSDTGYSSGTDNPVQTVNWYHALAFCNKLSLAEGLAPVYTVAGVDFATLTYAAIPRADNAAWNAAGADWSADGYRLPTEMEWMWAAMGASGSYTKAFAGSSGSNLVGDYAVFGYYSSDAGRTTNRRSNPVASKLPNELGLYDLSGNVWEWCWDRYGGYPDGTLVSDAPDGSGRGAATGMDRVLRGASWAVWSVSDCAVDYRNYYRPSGSSWDLGFRVVRP